MLEKKGTEAQVERHSGEGDVTVAQDGGQGHDGREAGCVEGRKKKAGP